MREHLPYSSILLGRLRSYDRTEESAKRRDGLTTIIGAGIFTNPPTSPSELEEPMIVFGMYPGIRRAGASSGPALPKRSTLPVYGICGCNICVFTSLNALRLLEGLMGNNAARGVVIRPSEERRASGRNETSLALCGSIGVFKSHLASDPDGRYASPLRKSQPCAAIKVEDIPKPSFSAGWRISVIAFVFQDVGCTLYAESSKDEKPAERRILGRVFGESNWP
jgi:hypothetical protein